MNWQNEDDEVLLLLRKEANRAEQALKDAVAEKCPGPHKPIQHRDHRPPWCRVCGRTTRGLRIQPAKES